MYACLVLKANAGVAETLPIFLDKLVPNPIYAILLSVTAVLIFGEVLPQASQRRVHHRVTAWPCARVTM